MDLATNLMKKLSILFFTLFLLGCFTHGQAQTKITGKVLDENDQTALVNATIMRLKAKVFILLDHRRANERGGLGLVKPKPIPNLWMVSILKYVVNFNLM